VIRTKPFEKDTFEKRREREKFSTPTEPDAYFEVIGLEPKAGGKPTFAVVRHKVDQR
jgi:hypothetical protein